MTETELKAVVDDLALRRRRVEEGGGVLEKEGYLQDRRWDDAAERIAGRDHVLRVRVFTAHGKVEASIEWKGPTHSTDGYKTREEIGSTVGDATALSEIMERLGLQVTRTIDREIVQYKLCGATVRFESYPRMDDLVEVEGTPEQIERAVAVVGIPRESYTADSLLAFMGRFEQRTGKRPVVCAADLDEEEW
jgi:predicted adenylyl cyclase CyaB